MGYRMSYRLRAVPIVWLILALVLPAAVALSLPAEATAGGQAVEAVAADGAAVSEFAVSKSGVPKSAGPEPACPCPPESEGGGCEAGLCAAGILTEGAHMASPGAAAVMPVRDLAATGAFRRGRDRPPRPGV